MKRQSIGDKVVNVIFYIILGFFVILCFYPVWYAFLASFSDPTYINSGKLIILPRGLTFGAYKYALAQRQLWLGYANTILYTVAGTLFGLIVCLPAGYALSRNDLPFRKIIMALFVFTMYFGGGLIPTYIVCKNLLGLSNNYAALIVPMLVSPFNIIIMRTFLQTTVPFELIEASTIDGAGEYTTLCRIVLPIMKPGIATVALLTALGYWNEWFLCMLYVTEKKLYPLQYLLMEMQKNSEFLARNSSMIGASGAEALKSLPSQTMRMAVVVFIVLPIACAYPFFQRYIVAGLTIGSVKG